MKKVFRNPDQGECIFTEEGVSFCSAGQEVFFPYGCMESISMSLMGVFQVNCHPRQCTFVVKFKDRAEMKEMVKYARNAMKTAPKGEPVVTDFTKSDAGNGISEELSPEEQLKQYKMLFVQGAISKEEYDAHKRMLKNQ